jgi:hypothetical protein
LCCYAEVAQKVMQRAHWEEEIEQWVLERLSRDADPIQVWLPRLG